jgi:acyl-coenzyme A synthetase/AMP-(fatty) acid ligase
MINKASLSGIAREEFWITSRPVPPDWGGPRDVQFSPYPEATHLRGLSPIESLARERPEKVAISDGKVRLTYADTLDRVYELTQRLRQATRPGAVVASIVHNTAAAPIITVAAFAAGRTLVPIDAGDPRERQMHIFADSGAEAVLVQAGVAIDDSFLPPDLPRIAVDPARATGAPRIECEPHPDGVPMSVAFTSGSTGRPKGIAYGHASTAGIRNFANTLHINPDDVIISVASLSTGGSRDVFAGLCCGAAIRIVDLKADGIGAALRAMQQDRVTILSFVPSVLRSIMQIEGVEASFRHLRVLDLYGDRVAADDIALFRSRLPASCHIRVTLATMETDAAFSWFVDDSKIEGALVPVGYLAPEKQIALVDADGIPVQPGEAGELLVRGPMAMGGWRAGRLTPGQFVADPDNAGHRIYATGDLIRLRPDGLAEYCGRRDQKLKIRGLWADLGEVEAALRLVAGVTDAVVVPKRRIGQPDCLIAFVVAEANARPTLRALRRAVAAETAEHMAPAEVHFLDAIPRLASHKPDLTRLAALAERASA